MLPCYPVVVLAPAGGLTFFCAGHLATCRIARFANPYVALRISFLYGLAATLGASITGLLSMRTTTGNFASLLAMNICTYLALAFGYFNFVNLNLTSIRIRLLTELLVSGAEMGESALLTRYSTERMALLRLERLVRGGHLVVENGRYFGGKRRFLVLARAFDGMRWFVMGGQKAESHALRKSVAAGAS